MPVIIGLSILSLVIVVASVIGWGCVWFAVLTGRMHWGFIYDLRSYIFYVPVIAAIWLFIFGTALLR